MAFRLSSQGYRDLAALEGNIRYVYDDRTGKPLSSYESAVGFPTIGLGVLIDTPEKREMFRPYLNGVQASASFIDQVNQSLITKWEDTLNAALSGAKLTQSMFDALFSLAWNTGVNSKWVQSVIANIRVGDYGSAALAIANGPITSGGSVIAGLVTRRAKEAARFVADGVPGSLSAAARKFLTANTALIVLSTMVVGTGLYLALSAPESKARA